MAAIGQQQVPDFMGKKVTQMNTRSRRILITTVSGLITGVVAVIASRYMLAEPLPSLGDATTTFALTAMGFAIGISSLRIKWWCHGPVLGFLFAIPLAFAGMWAKLYWSPKHLVVLAGGLAAGFVVELVATILLKAGNPLESRPSPRGLSRWPRSC